VTWLALDQYGQALVNLQRALVIRRETADRTGEVTTLSNVGTVYYCQGDYYQALEHLGQALAIARETGNDQSEQAILKLIKGIPASHN
jgi:tetratricopeptide (TPR) repeat protein